MPQKREKPVAQNETSGHSSTHIGQRIREVLESQGRTKAWFMAQLNQHRTNAYNIFARESIETDMLLKISDILGVDFFAIYSEELRKIHKSEI